MWLARRKGVLRKCRPPIPPEQPRTLSRTLFSLFLVERRHAVPVGRRRLAAPFRYFFRIHLVELAGGIHALQIEQAYLDLIPLLRAVMPQRLVPQPQLVVRVLVHFGLEPDRLVNGHRFVLALHLDAVDLAEYDVPDGVARGFADQDADAVAFGAALEARGDVDRIAHRRVRAPHLRTHVPDPHGAGIHADADHERRPAARGELGVQPLALALHLDGGEHAVARVLRVVHRRAPERHDRVADVLVERAAVLAADDGAHVRSEEHTSEFQSPCNLVCRLLLEKKKKEEARRAAGDEASGARATAPQSVGRALLLVTPPSQRGGCRAAAAARHESGDAVG